MAKRIGVTIGRYHPFHKGHEAIIRKLSKDYDKVYVFIAGNKSGKKNPFPFAIRKRIINLSLKGAGNVKFLMAVKTDDDGRIKGTGYVPDLIQRLKLNPKDSLDVLVGNDRFAGFKANIENEKSSLPLPLKQINVVRMPNVSVDNDTSVRISGTEVRSHLLAGNKEEVRKRMSSNLAGDFDEVYDKLRKYLGKYYHLHESIKLVTEAEALAVLKGIAHLEDLSPFAFIKFLEKWQNMEITGGLEISEKVDGSAQISFGTSSGKLYAKSKYGKPIMSPSAWPSLYYYDALRNAHYALDAVKNKIGMLKLIPNLKNPDGYDIVIDKKKYKDAIYPQYFCEVLWTQVPNSLEYGDNILMIYGVKVEGSHVSSSSFEKKVLDQLLAITGKSVTAKGAKWRLENKIVLSKSQFQIDTKVEYRKLKDILKDLKNQEVLLKRAKTSAEKKARASLLKKIKKIQEQLKVKFLATLRSMDPTFGKEGGTIEGIVIKDLESGAMVKVVDKDVFTTINSYFWHYRELLGKGLKIGEEWKVGVGTQLKYDMAEQVFGVPAFKTPSAAPFIKNRITKYKTPKELQSPNAQFNWRLYEFLKKETAISKKSSSQMLSEMVAVIDNALRSIEKLQKEWDKQKKSSLTKSVTDSKTGKIIKIVTMPEIVIKRNDTAFIATRKELQKLKSDMRRFSGMVKTDEAKKIILFKLFLGKKVLGKIH
tara:strand:- start:546 stop:2660 length:2115 start_codon:yes stop_codon:yes gene_type:complete